ncbi:hypothetical protein HBB16_17745 [Pseudonocardia sp. MCCB 268]|nr:hypothetical protein [Pseudonocardia cytotoxica]
MHYLKGLMTGTLTAARSAGTLADLADVQAVSRLGAHNGDLRLRPRLRGTGTPVLITLASPARRSRWTSSRGADRPVPAAAARRPRPRALPTFQPLLDPRRLRLRAMLAVLSELDLGTEPVLLGHSMERADRRPSPRTLGASAGR